MYSSNYDKNKLKKIILLLFGIGLLMSVLCFMALAPVKAAELETEPEETLYTDGSLTLLSDGTIVEHAESETEESTEVENEFTDDLLGNGDNVENDLLDEEYETLFDETLSDSETVSDDEEMEVSNSPLYITADTVYLQSGTNDDEMGIMASATSGDIVSLPTDNVISYKVRFNNHDYTAVFPLSVADSLAVSDGILCNIGSGAVTGRLFEDGFDTGSYSPYFVTLNSILSNSGNVNAYRYGSWSYVTFYSPRQGTGTPTLDSSTVYGNVYVLEEPKPFEGMSTTECIIIGLLIFIVAVFIVNTVRKEVKR